MLTSSFIAQCRLRSPSASLCKMCFNVLGFCTMRQDKPEGRTTKKQKPTAKSHNFLRQPTFWIGSPHRFLEFFSELPQEEPAKLGFSLQDSDCPALHSLSVRHCLVTQEGAEQFTDLHKRRLAKAH